jgi:hypothetical protein
MRIEEAQKFYDGLPEHEQKELLHEFTEFCSEFSSAIKAQIDGLKPPLSGDAGRLWADFLLG